MIKANFSNKKSSKKTRRTENFIASFNEGYAVGWAFPISEAFKAALDIRMTPRKLEGETKMIWTQGELFSFDTGDMIYDSKLAYENWTQYLSNGRYAIQILSASPAESEEKRGQVQYRLLEVHSSGLKEISQKLCSQDDFINFLKLGIKHE